MEGLILEQSNNEFYTSHSGLALVGAGINRYSDLGPRVGRLAGSSGQDRRNRHPALLPKAVVLGQERFPGHHRNAGRHVFPAIPGHQSRPLGRAHALAAGRGGRSRPDSAGRA